ncbi:hypothetical protein QR680_009147 [Steinernema hermaphroditum]|uniref:MULE transposase domain-containing protein n=1 Tax=Steinernema hermaphroditum TaxID=289476 RepID=A0AA39IJ76_9BILA|nr:hypothetical protein QR680_009147 [Steinernema hermaphroditum]
MASEALRQEEEEVFRRFKRGSSSGRHVTSEDEETDRLLLEGPLQSPIEESDAREAEDEEQVTAAFFIEEREKEANDYRRLSNGDIELERSSSRNNRIHLETFGTGVFSRNGHLYRRDRSKPLKTGLHSYRSTLSDEALASAADAGAFERNYQRTKRRVAQKDGDIECNIPDALSFSVPDRFRFFKDEVFLVRDINGNGMRALIFMSYHGTNLLARYKNVAFDGTFRIVPDHMLQLFTIHAFLDTRSSLPACYVIMNKKTSELYRRVFEAINELLGESGPPVSCALMTARL